MIDRLTALGRSGYAWSGVLLLTAVALVALANLGWGLVRVLPRAEDADVLVGLLGLVALEAPRWLAASTAHGEPVGRPGGVPA